MGKIYTKTGDEGMTSLVGGCRVPKDCVRLEAYGTVDELNSVLGWMMTAMSDEKARNAVQECQHVLFGIGSVLASQDEETARKMQGVTQEDVARLEQQMDEWERELPRRNGFVLPGGVEAAARAHICRTVCRRAERRIFALAEEAYVPCEVVKYINRLSDFLFVLALHENNLAAKDEILWQNNMRYQ